MKIAPKLPGKKGDSGVTAQDNRLFMEAVLWHIRTGLPCRDLPPVFGKWNSVFRRFHRWTENGIFECLFKEVLGASDFEYALIDGTITQVHQKAAGAKGGVRITPSDAHAGG